MNAYRAAAALLLCIAIVQPHTSEAQLIADIKKFFSSIPTFYSDNQPTFSENGK